MPTVQEGSDGMSEIGGRVKLRAPASGGHRVGAKVDPIVPSSLDT